MQISTLGFIFDSSLEKVLLIHKNRPEWQVGKVNGIGGKIEIGETPVEAMLRETEEETNLVIPAIEWTEVGKLETPQYLVHLFTVVYSGPLDEAETITDEEIQWYSVDQLPNKVHSNLRWLIPLCLDKLKNKEIQTVTVQY